MIDLGLVVVVVVAALVGSTGTGDKSVETVLVDAVVDVVVDVVDLTLDFFDVFDDLLMLFLLSLSSIGVCTSDKALVVAFN